MNIKTARELVRLDIDKMSLEELQRHRVRLIDAWRESRAQYGFPHAVRNGFFVRVLDHQADGYAPRDLYLSINLEFMLDRVEERERAILEGKQ